MVTSSQLDSATSVTATNLVTLIGAPLVVALAPEDAPRDAILRSHARVNLALCLIGALGVGGVVGPAVQRAHDVATGVAAAVLAQVAAALEHDGLAVAADVGDQLHALVGAHQGPPAGFLRQGVVVPEVGNRKLMPHIPGPALEEGFLFALEERFAEVAGNWKLA